MRSFAPVVAGFAQGQNSIIADGSRQPRRQASDTLLFFGVRIT